MTLDEDRPGVATLVATTPRGAAELMPDVSVVVVTWNSSATIEACLKTVVEAGPAEIIVVDNASADSTLHIVSEGFPQAAIVQTGANLGYPAACNEGMRRARGAYVLLVNPDAMLAPGAAVALASFLASHDDAAVVAPLIYDATGTLNLFTVRELPKLHLVLLRHLGILKAFPQSPFVHGELPLSRGVSGAHRVDYLCGAVVMLRRDFLEQSGYFDETIPMYIDDLEYSARVARAGLSSYVVPEAKATHIGGHSASLSPTRALLHMLEDGEAPWLYFRQYRGPGAAFVFRAIIFLTSGLRVIACATASPFLHGGLALLRRKASALVEWSLMPAKELERRIFATFARPARRP